MIIREKVRGTMTEVLPKEDSYGTIYIRTNIVRIDEENFKGWEYDEKQMTTSEYAIFLESEVARLAVEDLDNKLALTELYETILGG